MEAIYNFEFWIASDSHPYMPHVTAGRAGFFFSVTGIVEPQQYFDNSFQTEVIKPRTLKFTGMNFSN